LIINYQLSFINNNKL